MTYGSKPGLGAYAVDFVFCIDGSGSMVPMVDEVKRIASSMPHRFVEAMEETGREIEELRAKVIVFRDFETDSEALMSSSFFTLPEETEAFQKFTAEIKAYGGGDEPENALEALAAAMNTEWTDKGRNRRHIIVLFTDASAKKPEDSYREHPQYPREMPDSLAGLWDWWENGTPNGRLNSRAKRLVLFAPECSPWFDIANWPQVLFNPVTSGRGCIEAELEMVLTMAFQCMSY